jgi:hypothetical protein
MSGGHFDYAQYHMECIADEIERLVADNESLKRDEYGDFIGQHYPSLIIERFKEAAHTTRQAQEMAQRVDWLVSDDDGEESFMTRWDREVRQYFFEENKEDA